MNDLIKTRIQEVIVLASKLHWLQKNPAGYPLMQLSEVEKCMIAMVDNSQFEKMKQWVKESHNLRSVGGKL